MGKKSVIFWMFLGIFLVSIFFNSGCADKKSQSVDISKRYIERVSNQELKQLIRDIEESIRNKTENPLGFRMKKKLRFIGKQRGLEIQASSTSSNRPTAGLKVEIEEFDEMKNDEEARNAVHQAYSSTALKMDMVDSGWLDSPSFLITVPKKSVKDWGITTEGYAANSKYRFNVSLSISDERLRAKTRAEIRRIRELSFREVKNALGNLVVRLD